MRFRRSKAIGLMAAAASVAIVASGCAISSGGTSTSDLKGGSIKAISGLKGAKLVVGSKDFDEQLLLGQIAINALKAAGATPVDKTNIQGTNNARQALTSGNIDMYYDYTGTGWIDFLQHTKPIENPQAQFTAVAKQDKSKNNIVWWDYAPANNTYALAQKADTLAKYKVTTLSQYAALAKSNPSAATVCVESEFKSRPDGFPGMEKAYGFSVGAKYQKLLDTAVVYTELNKGGTCNFGEVFETDGRVTGLHLKLLTDDKKFFPIYNPALTVRGAIASKYPEIQALFKPINAKLTTATLSTLNKKVSVDGEKPAKVAQDWLKQEGFTG